MLEKIRFKFSPHTLLFFSTGNGLYRRQGEAVWVNRVKQSFSDNFIVSLRNNTLSIQQSSNT